MKERKFIYDVFKEPEDKLFNSILKELKERSYIEMNDIAIWLSKVGIFKIQPFYLCSEIAKVLTGKTFKPNEIICEQGDISNCIYVIYKG